MTRRQRRRHMLASGGGYLLRHSFTGADGTNLNAAAFDIGGLAGWTILSGTWSINANQGRKTASAITHEVISAESGKADITLNVKVTLPTTGYGGPIVRVSNDSNYWLIQLDEGGDTWTIYEQVAGAFTLRAGGAGPAQVAGTQYQVQVVASGTTIWATINGTNSISYPSASSNQTVTKHGINSYAINVDFDDFEVLG